MSDDFNGGIMPTDMQMANSELNFYRPEKADVLEPFFEKAYGSSASKSIAMGLRSQTPLLTKDELKDRGLRANTKFSATLWDCMTDTARTDPMNSVKAFCSRACDLRYARLDGFRDQQHEEIFSNKASVQKKPDRKPTGMRQKFIRILLGDMIRK